MYCRMGVTPGLRQVTLLISHQPPIPQAVCLVTVDLLCLLLVGGPCLLLWLVGMEVYTVKYLSPPH